MLTTKGPSAMSIDHHPAQAPRNKTTHPQAHPERVRTNFGDTPAYPGYEPDHLDTVNPDQLNRRSRKVILGAGVMSALIGAGVFLGSTINDAPKEGPVAGSVESDTNMGDSEGQGQGVTTMESIDYSKVDPNTLSVEQFYDDTTYPEEYRIRWARDIIEERTTPALLAEIQAKLAGGNRPALGELVAASANNTGDEIMVQNTVAGYIASTEADPEKGRKLLAGFLSSENPELEKAQDQLGGGKNPVLATYIVARADTTLPPYETPTFYNTPVGDYNPNGTPSKFMMVQNVFDGKFSEVTVKFEEGRWVTVDTIPVGDADWVKEPQSLDVQ